MFHPGLSCVRCAEAPGENKRDSPKKKGSAARKPWRSYANPPNPTNPNAVRIPSQGMLTTASTIRCRIGWHCSVQGYFTTVGAEMKKPGWWATRAKIQREANLA